jgi:hypothetical protein
VCVCVFCVGSMKEIRDVCVCVCVEEAERQRHVPTIYPATHMPRGHIPQKIAPERRHHRRPCLNAAAVVSATITTTSSSSSARARLGSGYCQVCMRRPQERAPDEGEGDEAWVCGVVVDACTGKRV